jgi:uncharacterized protein YebE (UPF0316 family)
MVLEQILNSQWYTYLILPLLIFFGRIIDVSIGTIRTIFVTKGFRKIAPFLSFFEIMIWLLVARQVLTDLSNIVAYFAYAGGFATGTYIGMKIEERLSVGKVMLRIITGVEPNNLIKELKTEKYGLTIVSAKGSEGEVKIIFSVMEKAQLKKALEILNKYHPYDSFYTIEDVRYAHENDPTQTSRKKTFGIFDFQRKSK